MSLQDEPLVTGWVYRAVLKREGGITVIKSYYQCQHLPQKEKKKNCTEAKADELERPWS